MNLNRLFLRVVPLILLFLMRTAEASQTGTVVSWGNQVIPYVAPGTQFTMIAAGYPHSLALKSDGTVIAWGENWVGQSTVPDGLNGVIAIATGGYADIGHSLALKSDGTVVAWGNTANTVTDGLNGIVAVAAGGAHNLALKNDGTVVAWGRIYNGSSYVNATVPDGLNGVVAIAAGGDHSLALKNDGTVVAWGRNGSGQGTVPDGLDGVVAIEVGLNHSLALKSDGTVVAWGQIWTGSSHVLATVPDGLSGVVAIATGDSHSLALKNDGTVVAWGWNGYGQSTVPDGLNGVVAIAAGFNHSLALKSDGTIIAWGYTVPVGLNGVVAIAAGGDHSLVLKNDGTVVAWGDNWSGQSTVPDDLNSVVAIAAGSGHSLALKNDGTVVAWGDNGAGQRIVPDGLNGVVAIAAGGDHCLVLKGDGTVVAWGADWAGQSTVPDDLNSVVAIAAGSGHSLALKNDGTVVAWGDNWYGQSTVPGGLNGVMAIAAGPDFSVALVGDSTTQGPKITTPPQSQDAQFGVSVMFSVAASGTPPLQYQWRRNGVNLPGATSATLTLNPVTAADSGGYSVAVWNAYGSAISDTAQLTVSQPLILTPTSLTPTTAQSTPALLVSCPISTSQLKVFSNGSFITAGALDSGKKTIVLTHGWIPSAGPVALTSGLNGWPLDFANALVANGVGANANIVAWDWDCAAQSLACNPSSAAGNTQDQGVGLAQALSVKLGAGYAHQIHFIGHSLGTLLNARAANQLHAGGFDPSKTQMTLFDEASVATFTDCFKLLWLATAGRPSNSQNYLQPLPGHFSWADNYISLVGDLQDGAVNVILTNGLPATATGIANLIGKAATFHAYPGSWYEETINTDISAMGHRWSFERGGFSGAPTADKVFIQANNGSEWNLTETLDGANWLNERYKVYHKAVAVAGAQTVSAGLSGGNVSGLSVYGAPASVSIILRLITGVGGSVLPLSSPRPFGGGSGVTNIPAYAWIPMTVPSNAVAMSFDFMLEGDGQSDSFAVALNGTNVLSVETGLIQTNVTLNSGMIDVADYAGKEVELFFGLVGGTSTNASVTVSNVEFFVVQPPVLQAQLADTSIVLSWPLWAQEFSLQSTTNLANMNSWTALTNEPAIVDLENTVTNAISNGARFYRLTK